MYGDTLTPWSRKKAEKYVEHLTSIVECKFTKKVPRMDVLTSIHTPVVDKVPTLLQTSGTNAETVKRSTVFAVVRMQTSSL